MVRSNGNFTWTIVCFTLVLLTINLLTVTGHALDTPRTPPSVTSTRVSDLHLRRFLGYGPSSTYGARWRRKNCFFAFHLSMLFIQEQDFISFSRFPGAMDNINCLC